MRMFRPSVQPHAGRPSLLGRRRLHIEPLESRQLLSVIPITVSTGPITVQETRTSYGVRVAGLAMEKAGFQVERVRQAVGRVDAHYQGAVAQAGKLEAGGRGQAGFAHPSLAAE